MVFMRQLSEYVRECRSTMRWYSFHGLCALRIRKLQSHEAIASIVSYRTNSGEFVCLSQKSEDLA